jgi:hypothetical protein
MATATVEEPCRELGRVVSAPCQELVDKRVGMKARESGGDRRRLDPTGAYHGRPRRRVTLNWTNGRVNVHIAMVP